MKASPEATYEERLFSGGFRTWLHESRFHWLRRKILELGCPQDSVVEMGCNNAKTIRYLPRFPKRYVGFDRDPFNLNLAHELWKDYPNYSFYQCEKPEDLVLNEQFDIGICMETMEHLSDSCLDGYLRWLAGAVRHYLFVTVPNEKGLLFAAKHIAQRIQGDYYEPYSASEFWHQLRGKTEYVVHDQHKGFDYDRLIGTVSQYFQVQGRAGLPFAKLPTACGFTVAIVAKAAAPVG